MEAAFGVNSDTLLIGTAAQVAAQRYFDSPWQEDRIDDAIEAAVIACGDFKPQEGLNSLCHKANYVLGMAQARMRQNATAESADSNFCAVFSDLVAKDVDTTDWLERNVGKSVVFSPSVVDAYDIDYDWGADNIVFYIDGQYWGVDHLARHLAECVSTPELAALFETDDFDDIAVNTEILRDRLITWSESQDTFVELVPEEIEEKIVPEILTKFGTLTEHGPVYTDVRLVTCEAPTGNQRHVNEEVEWDLLTEEQGRKTDIKFSAVGANHGAPGYNKADAVMVVSRHAPLIERTARAITLVTSGYAKAIPIEAILDDEVIDSLLMEIYTVVTTLLITESSYNRVCTEFAQRIATLVKRQGLFAALREKLGVSWEDWDKDDERDTFAGNNEELRSLIIAEVLAGNVYVARAAAVLAKIDGMHPLHARELCDTVWARTKQLCIAFGQGRFSYEASMIVADTVYPLFNRHLMNTRVGIVGSGWTAEDITKLTANIGRFAIVGCNNIAKSIAEKLDVEYYAIPVACHPRGRAWANGQVCAVSTHALVEASKSVHAEKFEQLKAVGVVSRFRVLQSKNL